MMGYVRLGGLRGCVGAALLLAAGCAAGGNASWQSPESSAAATPSPETAPALPVDRDQAGPAEPNSKPHDCTRQCTHYYDGSELVELPGHRHEPGCGHAWDSEHWVSVWPADKVGSGSHVCTEQCRDHYRKGARIITAYRHNHRAGCGHLWDGRNWLLVKQD